MQFTMVFAISLFGFRYGPKLFTGLTIFGYSEARRKDSEHYILDNTRIKGLGWLPHYSFEEGIKKTIDWFEKNSFWYEQLNW